MEKRSRKGIIIGITSLFLVTLILLGLTYAYYRTRIIGNESTDPSISVQSKKMEIVYQDGTADLIITEKIEPDNEKDYTKTFSVKNTGDVTTNYSVIFDNVVNEFGMYIDWIYTLEYGGKSVTGYVKRSDEQVVLNNISIAPGETEEFTLKLKYKETGIDQSFDMGKKLSLRVNITDSPIVDAVSKTGAELLATVDSNKIITLTEDTILTTSLVLKDSVNELNLNGYTLIINPTEEGGSAHIETQTTQTIKNGTIIRGENLTNSSLVFAHGGDLTLDSVILDGNMVTAIGIQADDYAVAGVHCLSCNTLTITDSIIKNNYGTGEGLGVRVYGTNIEKLTINNSEIRDNYLQKSLASAIYALGVNDIEIINSKILNNIAEVGTGTVNIVSCGNVVIDEDTEIKYNVATSAGGVRIEGTNATINATIEGNIARASDGNGGGVYTLLKDSSQQVKLNGKIINNIAGGAGGGVYVNGPKSSAMMGDVTIQSATITGNVAIGTPAVDTLKDGGGAGIYVARGRAIIEGPTIINNNISMSNIGNAILLSHANGNVNGGYLHIKKNSGTIIEGSVKVHESYGTLDLEDGVTQNGELITSTSE